MKNNSDLMEDDALAFVCMKYELPQIYEIADAMALFGGVGEGDMGGGSDEDFGAADGMEDHSDDYTDFDLVD